MREERADKGAEKGWAYRKNWVEESDERERERIWT